GSGPSGLSAAADLARLGYRVTVFEKEAKAGGLLRYGIGPHRLPREILDHEIEYIRRLGVQIKTSSPVNISGGLKKMQEEFDVVIVASGAWVDRFLGVPGEELEGVEGCISFLKRLYQNEEKEMKSLIREDEKVVVIGDGNAAFDLARTVKRLEADVSILTWFPEDIIPADKQEIKEAMEEGITIIDRSQVVSFSGHNGRLDRLNCKPTEPGEPDAQGIPWPVIISNCKSFELEFDRALVAIGQAGPLKGGGVPPGINITESGFIDVDGSMQTGVPAVYAAGDVVNGPSTIVEAMASGRVLARSVHEAISGKKVATAKVSRPEDIDFPEISGEIPSLSRPAMPERQPASRTDNFSEVALGFSEAQILFESERCLQCGICSECLICAEACGQIAAINHGELSEEVIEQAGVVIIADPEAGPPVKGEDVIRAYGPKTAKTEVTDMITRGFAAAANAMILLEESSLRIKGHGASFSPPDPELSPVIRLGVFVCRCNDAFGWSDGMEDYVAGLTKKDNIVYSEVLNSACVPEGSADILRAVREKGITRVVLASCVCCPLDFICSACTDQRSRLKDSLFKGTGVSRSMIETCNLRGEVLPFLKYDESKALSRFTGLIGRSIDRAKRLKALPSLVRNYNFTTAVIGDSEAALNSAQVLAEAGLEVFMFGTPGNPLTTELTHPNIHCFEKSLLRGIGGTLGDFQIFMEYDGKSRVFQVGSIILGEKARKVIPYIIQEGLPVSFVASATQKIGITGIPFRYPGMTSIAGLFLANPTGLRVSERKKGSAAAVLAASVMPRGPRQSKGYTVVVDGDLCRGCGRCLKVCPYHAITLQENSVGGWQAVADEALCKGCGNCISVCPSNAADSPYRDRAYLEQLIEEVII
ncbi:FAD-dependent oxidoreductase, partial [Thermodesulfobacteriota bacterium]